MDLIGPLRRVLDPLVANTSFVLTGLEPLVAGAPGGYGFLEYHGVLNDGTVVLIGFYQRSAMRTVTAEMWSPGTVSGNTVQPSGTPIASRYQAWSYDEIGDVDALAWSIVAEVATWLKVLEPTDDPDVGTPPAEA